MIDPDSKDWKQHWQRRMDAAQTESTALVSGALYPRTPYGQDYSEMKASEMLPQCRDCGVSLGQLHVPTCCVERCPRCKVQRISCQCDDGPSHPFAPFKTVKDEEPTEENAKKYCEERAAELRSRPNSCPDDPDKKCPTKPKPTQPGVPIGPLPVPILQPRPVDPIFAPWEPIENPVTLPPPVIPVSPIEPVPFPILP